MAAKTLRSHAYAALGRIGMRYFKNTDIAKSIFKTIDSILPTLAETDIEGSTCEKLVDKMDLL